MMKTDTIKYCIPTNMTRGIYKLLSPCNRFYIGSTNNFKRRYREHFKKLISNKHENTFLQNHFNKTPVNWQFILVQNVDTEADLLIIEQSYLDNALKDSNCVNLNIFATKPPSWLNKKHTTKTIEAMKKRVPWNKNGPGPYRGKKHTLETRNKIHISKQRKSKIYKFQHEIYGVHKLSVINLVKKLPELQLVTTGLRRVANASIKNYRGWQLTE